MQITLFGTGSGIPNSKYTDRPFRSYAGWYTEIGSDSLLFDMGVGISHKMLLSGINLLLKPNHVFITHHHLDHTSDLFQLMIGRSYVARRRNVNKLKVIAPGSFVRIINEIWKMYGKEFKLEDVAEIIEISDGFSYSTGKLEITTSPIKHTEDSVCYRLKFENKSLIYSGDMGYDERISEFGKDADIAILECSFPSKEDVAGGNHLCPEDIGRLAKLGNFKKVVLTHMFPECEGREEEMRKKIIELAGCEVVIPQDMDRIEI